MSDIDLNNFPGFILNKLNIIGELIGVSYFDLSTLEVKDNFLNIDILFLGEKKRVTSFITNDTISIVVSNKDNQVYSVHFIKINNDVALKIKSVNNTIERSYYKINVNLLNGGFTPVNEDEFTLKYEKR
ncbi:MAG: hypothetical protein MR779_00430 [Tenericutes bacterium]|nr:hypothetical protein [Mycoplasmatota bacterium]